MSHWAFVTAAYVVAVGGVTLLLVWAFARMRSAEAAADALKRGE